jgi:hypothetical protein
MNNLYLLKRYCKFYKKFLLIYILISELNNPFSNNFCKYYALLLVIISNKKNNLKIKSVSEKLKLYSYETNFYFSVSKKI